MKKCTVCEETKPPSEFFKNKNLCKNCKREREKGYRKRNREFIINYKKSSSCKKCGEDRWYILVFHHNNSNDKVMGIADMGRSVISLKRIKKEIEKCTVLCHNCHFELHYFEENKTQ